MEKEHQSESNLYTRHEELRIFGGYRKLLNVFIRALGGKFESELGFDTNDKIAGIQRGFTDGTNFFFRDYLNGTHGKIREKVYEDNEDKNHKIHYVFKILFDSGNSVVFSRDGYKINGVFSLDSYLKRLDNKSRENFFEINKKLNEIEYTHFTSKEYLEGFEHSEQIDKLIKNLRENLVSNLSSEARNGG